MVISQKSGLLFSLLMLFMMGTASPALSESTGYLEELIRIALEQNSEIRSARSRIIESTEKISQAGTLPDPQLGFEYFLQPVETRTGPQEASISLKQMIPWLEQLSLNKKLKENEVEIDKAYLIKTQHGVIRKLKEAYIEYGYLSQAKKITGQILELMNYLEGIVRTNYSSGKSTYADVLKLQIEIDTLKNRQKSLADNGTPVRVRINNILNTDRNMARPLPEKIPSITLDKGEDEIISLFHLNSPIILAGQQKIKTNRTKMDIAEQGFYPDINLSVKTIFTGESEFGNPPDSGRDPVIAGLSFSLPLFNKSRHGAVAEKQASIRTAQSELEKLKDSIDSEIEMSLFRYREAERLQGLYSESLIPKVRQELDVSLEAFQGGQHTISELIDSEKKWLNFELARVRAQADMAIQVARLEELTGTTLAKWNQDT